MRYASGDLFSCRRAWIRALHSDHNGILIGICPDADSMLWMTLYKSTINEVD